MLTTELILTILLLVICSFSLLLLFLYCIKDIKIKQEEKECKDIQNYIEMTDRLNKMKW